MLRARVVPLLLLVAAACSRTPAPNRSLTGAPAAKLAVEQFLAAVKAQDLQAMSTAWGTVKGPARDQMERTELEKREIIMQGCYEHDKYRILDDVPSTEGRRLIRVELTKGAITARPRFTAVKGPSDRWYVEDADIQAVQRICRS